MLRIDVHHHFFSPALAKQRSIGWRIPSENLPWTPQISLKFLEDTGIDMAILSIPAYAEGCPSPENRALARKHNDFIAQVCATYPDRFGFFGTVPFLDDIEGVLSEIAYALDILHADGIALSSTYGEGDFGSKDASYLLQTLLDDFDVLSAYIGDDRYDRIWAELNRRKAVVFLHGAQTPSSIPWPHDFLGLPVTEVPNETFKAAGHLVVTGKKRRYREVKIILAHMGGSMPMLASRVAVLSPHMGCPLTSEEILEDFKSFYFDTALVSYDANLALADSFIGPEQLLFGTDFPAVSQGMTEWYTTHLEQYYAHDPRRLEAVMSGNTLKLFPRLRDKLSKGRHGMQSRM